MIPQGFISNFIEKTFRQLYILLHLPEQIVLLRKKSYAQMEDYCFEERVKISHSNNTKLRKTRKYKNSKFWTVEKCIEKFVTTILIKTKDLKYLFY